MTKTLKPTVTQAGGIGFPYQFHIFFEEAFYVLATPFYTWIVLA